MANRTRGMNALTALGFTALGVGYLWELVRKDGSAGTPVGPADNLQGRRGGGLGRLAEAARPGVYRDGIRNVKVYPAGTIDNRLKFIVDQIRRDSMDKKTITEARSIVSGKCKVERGGLDWCVPQKDWLGELKMLFFAVTNPNSPYAMRYTRDHATVDLFGSSDSHRRLPSGDCDDFTIRLGALCRAIGYAVKCRIVAPAGQPNQWAHIYLMVGDEAGNPNPQRWLPLDPTEPQHGPFWEVPKRLISTVKDYDV